MCVQRRLHTSEINLYNWNSSVPLGLRGASLLGMCNLFNSCLFTTHLSLERGFFPGTSTWLSHEGCTAWAALILFLILRLRRAEVSAYLVNSLGVVSLPNILSHLKYLAAKFSCLNVPFFLQVMPYIQVHGGSVSLGKLAADFPYAFWKCLEDTRLTTQLNLPL